MDDERGKSPGWVAHLWRRVNRPLVGYFLLTFWALWWAASFSLGYLAYPRIFWFPAWNFLGLDVLHNTRAVHALWNHSNPYLVDFGDPRGLYSYPPIVLLQFAWAILIPRDPLVYAEAVWALATAAIVAWATMAALRVRKSLGGNRISAPLAISMMLLSTPVIFEMERGNCDALVLLWITLAALFMRRRTAGAQIMAGFLLAVAVWTKVYPGWAVLGLPIVKRWRVFWATAAAGILIPLASYNYTLDFVHTAMQVSQGNRIVFLFKDTKIVKQNPLYENKGGLAYYGHSFTSYWDLLWGRTGFLLPRKVPALVGSALVLGLLVSPTMYRLWLVPDATPLIYPLFLLLTAVGTFWLPLSFDYNLFFVSLLLFCVFRWRDGWYLRLMFVGTLIFLQPICINVNISNQQWIKPEEILLILKLSGLLTGSICLARRARELIAEDRIKRT